MSDHIIETEQVGPYTVEVVYDPYCENPREWCDHESVMVCFHKRYDLGDKDKHDYHSEHYTSWAELEEAIERDYPRCVILPLYIYSHGGGGIAISTSPFSCPWNSGRLGLIFLSEDGIKTIYGVTEITPELRERAEGLLQEEVREYDDWGQGRCCGWIVKNKDGNVVDSCWGYIGDTSYPLDEGIRSAKWLIGHEQKTKHIYAIQ